AGEPMLQGWNGAELSPGPGVTLRDDLAEFIAKNAMTTYHFAGTCRMGDDSTAPVDPELLLRGIGRLRVVDASVIPTTPVSALNAPSMVIGWEAAERMLGTRQRASESQTASRTLP
ncbi:MAG: GMC oxidoreductase, partial [Myxococcota bacterium]